MTAISSFFTFLGISIVRNSHNSTQFCQLKFNKLFPPPPLRFNCYTSSAAVLDSGISTDTPATPSTISSHPWSEWVAFVDRLKVKGYFNSHAAVGNHEWVIDYTDMNLLKDACLSFARDRYDIFKSLSTQDIQTLVNKGCPNLLRKAVNSAKRLRAYLELDEGDVCGSCNLRGSCDRAYILLNESEASARTVDIVRMLLFYALDPLVISGQNKPPGRDFIEASARKLLSELTELGELPPNPDLPKPSFMTSQPKKKSSSQDADIKLGDWVCTNCKSTNFATNAQCRSCGENAARVRGDYVGMKKGDWICSACSFMNFSRNLRCLKCKADAPKNVSSDVSEMKMGDWNCPGCTFMNFSSNKKCLRCQEPRPPRKLRPGEWECPDCDFLNFSRNNSCKRCNFKRQHQEFITQYDEQTWKRPY